MPDWNGRKMLDPPLQIVIKTNASLRGWGAYSCGTFTGDVGHRRILIKSDNITVVPYLNHMGVQSLKH